MAAQNWFSIDFLLKCLPLHFKNITAKEKWIFEASIHCIKLYKTWHHLYGRVKIFPFMLVCHDGFIKRDPAQISWIMAKLRWNKLQPYNPYGGFSLHHIPKYIQKIDGWDNILKASIIGTSMSDILPMQSSFTLSDWHT